METRKSIDECSGEEWNAAAKGHWDFLRTSKVYEEDPVYSQQDDLFSESMFDKADEQSEARQEIEDWMRQEEILDTVVQCLGDWDAIAYCQGTVLRILMDNQNVTNKNAITVAKRHLDRLSLLVNSTEGVNW